MQTGPQLISKTVDGGVEVEASGRWTAESAARLDSEFNAIIGQIHPGSTLRLRMANVDAFDTYGACLLNSLERKLREREARFELPDLPERFADLAQKVSASETAAPMPGEKKGWARITIPYAASCRDGVNLLVKLGNNRCSKENGVVKGSIAEWVEIKFLSKSVQSAQ